MRKIFNSVGTFGPAGLLTWLAFNNCQTDQAIIALCLSMSCVAIGLSGYVVNFTDIAPNYAGTLVGLINTSNSVMGFLSPIVTGILTDNNVGFCLW